MNELERRPSAPDRGSLSPGLSGRFADARALHGGSPAGERRLAAALSALDGEHGPRASALRGRLLVLLLRPALARRELDAALAADPSLDEARLWRAQARLALRDAGAALADLDALSAGRRPSAWEEHLRGVALLGLGRPAEAERLLRSAARRGAAAAGAMLALALAERGRFGAARSALARARRGRGADAALLDGFEGLIRRQEGDLEGSLRALIRASRGPRPYAWVLSHRADVHNRMGFYAQALADLKRYHELLPAEPSAFAQAANVLYDQAFYDEALKAIRAAAALSPAAPDLQARRAQILVSAGRLTEAVRVLRAALRRSPGHVHLREELVEAAVMAGDAALAREELARGRLEGTPFGLVLRGVLLVRERLRPAARELFAGAARALPRGDALRERADFYAEIARSLDAPAAPFPGLTLCGVGVRHPFQASAETIRALAAARTIYTNLPDIEARRFLALFPGRVVSVPRRPDRTNLDRARWVASRLNPGEPAAFLTRIHPFIYRRMGYELDRLCRAAEIPVRALGAVSLTELAICRAVDGGAEPPAGALRVFDIGWLNRHPGELRPADPTVVYCIGDDSERPRLVRLLSRRCRAAGGAFLLGGSGDREDRAPWVPWRRLPAALKLADIGCVLYVPAGKGKRAKAPAAGAPVVRLFGLGSSPGEETMEALAALKGSAAPKKSVLDCGRPQSSTVAGLSSALAAARRHGEAAIALPGGFPLETPYARRVLSACRKARLAVRCEPSVSPAASAYAREGFCLGGDYGWQATGICTEARLAADPSLRSPLFPLVVHGGKSARIVAPQTPPAVPGPDVRP